MAFETIICSFSLSVEKGPHCHCVDKHCLSKGSTMSGCVTRNLANYLNSQNTASKEISDWYMLDKALSSPETLESKKILDKFAVRSN